MKRTNVEVTKLGKKELATLVGQEGVSKSAKIKELFDMGYEVKEIAEALGIRYNFAYNVIQNYIVVNDIEVETSKKESKKDKVWEMFDKGMTLSEVSKELKTNYNYVWKLHKEWKEQVVAEVQAEEGGK